MHAEKCNGKREESITLTFCWQLQVCNMYVQIHRSVQYISTTQLLSPYVHPSPSQLALHYSGNYCGSALELNDLNRTSFILHTTYNTTEHILLSAAAVVVQCYALFRPLLRLHIGRRRHLCNPRQEKIWQVSIVDDTSTIMYVIARCSIFCCHTICSCQSDSCKCQIISVIAQHT